jgi:isocitrate/isopropylmalate dehydrogenase
MDILLLEAISLRKITRQGSTRIVEAAFGLARREKRRVHKANVLRVSDGLFLECAPAVAAKYPDVAYEEKIVDAMAALLVREPIRRHRHDQHVRRHSLRPGV